MRATALAHERRRGSDIEPSEATTLAAEGGPEESATRRARATAAESSPAFSARKSEPAR
jgi:hypothetical protein